MKKILTISAFAILALLASCDQTPRLVVDGQIDDAADSMLVLEWMGLDGVKAIDSVKLGADGKFSFKTDAPQNPEFYALRIGSHRINFSADSAQTISFAAKLPSMSYDYTVSGDDNSLKIKEISLLQSKLQSQILAVENDGSLYPGEIADSITALVDAYKEKMKTEYIYPEPMKAYAYYAVCQAISDGYAVYQIFDPLNNRDDVKVYAAVATSWDGFYPDAKRTEQLCNMVIKGMENTAQPTQRVMEIPDSKVSEVGIIDVNLPDADSKFHSITDLKGKVVMLDFTVYAAKQSPERIRMLRELYERYHSQGFEIYQVSLDDDNHFWKTQCQNLPWVCVHETDGTATRLYNVQNVPTYFLINRDNELVIRSEMVETSLEDELQKLL